MSERENLVLISILKSGIIFHGRDGINATKYFNGSESFSSSYPVSPRIEELSSGEFYLEDFFDPKVLETIKKQRNEARDGRDCPQYNIKVKLVQCHFCCYGHLARGCHYPDSCETVGCYESDPTYIDQEFEES